MPFAVYMLQSTAELRVTKKEEFTTQLGWPYGSLLMYSKCSIFLLDVGSDNFDCHSKIMLFCLPDQRGR